MIDESREQAYKIAFYSDPTVASIMEKLIAEWERNQQKGIPLDYASEEELKAMYTIAVKISETPPHVLMARYLRGLMSTGRKEG